MPGQILPRECALDMKFMKAAAALVRGVKEEKKINLRPITHANIKTAAPHVERH